MVPIFPILQKSTEPRFGFPILVYFLSNTDALAFGTQTHVTTIPTIYLHPKQMSAHNTMRNDYAADSLERKPHPSFNDRQLVINTAALACQLNGIHRISQPTFAIQATVSVEG